MSEVRWHHVAVRAVALLLIVLAHLVIAVPVLLAAAPRGRRGLQAAAQELVRALLVRLGPSFVKGAQILATRRDLLPPAWCHSLAQLHDRVPPMPAGQARRVLAEAGLPADAEPVASGSIACVYRGLAPDGGSVALKVRRPGVERKIRTDFAVMAAGARVMQLLPPMRRLPARLMVEQIGAAVSRQADFGQELRTMEELRAKLADLGHLHIPRPLPELCNDRVLVMEHVDGLDDAAPAPEAARRVLQLVYRMLFVDGLVHCDMHPGNLYLRPDGTIVLLDAGFVVRLEPKVRALFAEFFLAMARGDGPRCADIVHASAAEVAPDADLPAFRSGVTALVDSTTGRPASEFSLVTFAATLFDLQRRHGLFAAPEFVFPLLALLVLEGRINELHADIDFQAEAIPVLITATRGS